MLRDHQCALVWVDACRRPGCIGCMSANWCHESWHTSKTVLRCPVSPSESLEVATLAYTALKLPCPWDMSREAGQPYRLHLLQALANSWHEPDMALLQFLQHGAVSALPPSLQWPAKKPDSALPPDLEICIAVGKLNVVFAEGKEPPLVLDSTVCQVNTRCHLPERLSLPMASDLALSTQPPPGAFVGASIDFKAAHKQVLKSMAFYSLYRVCHFGGCFSAFWWQRTGAFLLRQVHGLEAPQSLPFCGRPSVCTLPG